jgi:hypothetical protein
LQAAVATDVMIVSTDMIVADDGHVTVISSTVGLNVNNSIK